MKKKGFTLVELLVVIAIIALLMGILMPALARVRQIAFRMVCGTNLSGIGKAMLIYANDYEDELPRAGGPNATWTNKIVFNPVPNNAATAYSVNASTGKGIATISSSLYLLVKYAEVTTKSFVCKGDSGVTEYEPGSNIDVVTLWDFGATPMNHCSYTYHQPYCMYPLTTSSDPGMAVAADPTPWEDTKRDWTNYDPIKGTKESRKIGNSPTHQDEGQNVLFLDSHVNFESDATCGINDDNIYTQAIQSTTPPEIRKGNKPTTGGLVPLSRSDNLLLMDFGTGTGGSKGRDCFLGDTLVSVDGKLIPMSQVAAGQTLGNSASVEKLDEHVGSFECRDIVLENGNTIGVIGAHLFMLDSGIWVHAQDLRSGLNLKTQNGSIAIKSVTMRSEPYVGTVYNVRVSKSEQYMVGQDYVVVRDW